MHLKVIAATFVVMLAGTSSLSATTILDNSTPTGGLIALGQPINAHDSGDQYWAQTFTTPTIDTEAHSLRFRINNSRVSPYMGQRTDGDLPFRVLLTEVNMAGGFHPGNILFESNRQVVTYTSPSSSMPQSFEILYPNVQLDPNTQYAFILDAFTDADYLDGIFPDGVMDSANGYNGGTFYSMHVPPDANNVPIGTRAEQFARTWGSFSASQNIDLAFSMTFVPEPSALILAALGGVALLVPRRRCA